ncbi:MAG: pyridoxamine kinase [Ruminococcaceae bacterium]|nr:pyridoxamine kinase [Oscillospiraceae bacterium]
MDYKRVLTVQDISCVGQCSLTVALPIISACGVETAVLPSAVLSTHTAGFSGFTFRDLTEDMPAIAAHWQKENLAFDAIYTGYLGSTEQIDYVKALFDTVLKAGGVRVVDPAMADNGKLYPLFDMAYVEAMKGLCGAADVVVPNLTEACFLTDTPYTEQYDRAYIDDVVAKLHALGAKTVVFTGVSFAAGRTGVLVSEDGAAQYYEHPKRQNSCHGTGDIYASAFVGALVRGKSAVDAARIAADYTVACIDTTAKLDNHWYGAAFEPVLGELIDLLK